MKVPFYNLAVDNLDSAGFFASLAQRLESDEQVVVNFLNAHCFNVAQKNEAYRRALLAGTFLLNDGIGVEIGAGLLGFRFRENLNGTDLIPRLLALCEERGLPVFLLGAKPEVISVARDNLQKSFPRLVIAGVADGFFKDHGEMVRTITDSGARVLVTGMGVPYQELWVEQHRREMPSVRVLVSGGAVFDFLSGTVSRAPVWVRNVKLEWCYRLMQEPRRLFRRYVIGNFVFLYHILRLRFR